MNLPTQFQQYIHLSRYARWRDDLGRRETWTETVSRFYDFFVDHLTNKCGMDPKDVTRSMAGIYQSILHLEVAPSMRALMTAGEALKKENLASFNCSYVAIDNPRAFDEILYILMNGTGVGFSVERQCISRLPRIHESFHDTDTVIIVHDSRIGWAKAFKELIALLYSGQVPKWDLSNVRPAGARLKTFGGRASGPGPLDNLFRFTVSLFKRAAGRKLHSLECHDLVCQIGAAVVVGGTRRSALISLSALNDDRMRNAKNGSWWVESPHRSLANNSVVYTEKPDMDAFLREWFTLYESKSGERGIFNRVAAHKKMAENGRRDTDYEVGTNPCGEIILRPQEKCNLSEVIVRPEDDLESLKHKVRIASVIGTFQSTLTDFKYIRSIWKHNAEEERLLGVSLTGVMDHPVLSGNKGLDVLADWLIGMKRSAIETNRGWAEKLGINQSAAITTVKPSGTVSALCGTSSGIHQSFAPYYIRRVRADNKDPLAHYMRDAGVPCEPDVMYIDNMLVFSFPMMAPDDATSKIRVSGVDHLEIWKTYRKHWCEHNPSVTISYRDNDFLQIGQWVWDNWDEICGVSFLPQSDHIYRQAPFEKITEAEYQERLAQMPQLDWSRLTDYESDDHTEGSQELACTASGCEL